MKGSLICLFFCALCFGCFNHLFAQYPSLKSTSGIKIDGYKPYIYVNPYSNRPVSGGSSGYRTYSSSSSGTSGTYQRMSVGMNERFLPTELSPEEREALRKKQLADVKQAEKAIVETILTGDLDQLKTSLNEYYAKSNLAGTYRSSPYAFMIQSEWPDKISVTSGTLSHYNEFFRPKPVSADIPLGMIESLSPNERSLHFRLDTLRYRHRFSIPETAHLLADLIMTRIFVRDYSFERREKGILLMEEAMSYYTRTIPYWERFDDLRGINYFLSGRKTLGSMLMATAIKRSPERKKQIIERLKREMAMAYMDTLTDSWLNRLKSDAMDTFAGSSPLNELAFIRTFANRELAEKGMQILNELQTRYYAKSNSGRNDTLFLNAVSFRYADMLIMMAAALENDDEIRRIFNRVRAAATYDLSSRLKYNEQASVYVDSNMRMFFKDKPDSLRFWVEKNKATTRINILKLNIRYLSSFPVYILIALEKYQLLQELLKPELNRFSGFTKTELNYEMNWQDVPPDVAIELMESLESAGIIFDWKKN